MIRVCIQRTFAASPVIIACLVRLRGVFLVNNKFNFLNNVYRIHYSQKLNPLSFGLLAGCCFSKQSENAEADPITSHRVIGSETKRPTYHSDACEGLHNEAVESGSLSSTIHSGHTRFANADERKISCDQTKKIRIDNEVPSNVEGSLRTDSVISVDINKIACVSDDVKASVPLKRLSGEIINQGKSKCQKLDEEVIKKELESSVDEIIGSETGHSVTSDITKSVVPEVDVQRPEKEEIHDTSKDEETSSRKSKKKPKQRPNYFVSMKISNPVIQKSLEAVQAHIVEQNSKLKPAVVPLKKLHITLMVLYLSNEEEHEKALNVLKSFHETLNADMCKSPLKLEFRGLDSFNGKVLFTKVKQGDALDRLNNIADDVVKHFKDASIPSTDKKEFNPHLTVMKLSRAPKLFRQGIKKIDPSLYSSYKDNIFGSELIKSIELLSMMGTEATSGYYKGHQLFFDVADKSDVATPSAALAEELQNKKQEMSQSAQQHLERLIASSSSNKNKLTSSNSADTNNSLGAKTKNSEK